MTNSVALILLCLCRSDNWSGGIRIAFNEDEGSVEVCVVRSCPTTKPNCSVAFLDVDFETMMFLQVQ